ncbi:MAG: ferritin-like domain-containing protein, partial [Terriglobales bacterium]
GPLLKMALKNEAEAAEIAALWVATTPELDAKLALARHAGDEARHYELLAAAAREQGVDLAGFDPLTPPSPVLEYLRTLETTVERVAAALVTREAMGARRNAQFLKLLEAGGHKSLAALYRDVINPDEERHHRSGCELLAQLAASPDAQELARHAASRLLEIGDRVRTTVMEKTGATCVPGC